MTWVKVLSPWLTCCVILGSSLYVFEPQGFSHQCYRGNRTCMSGLPHGLWGRTTRKRYGGVALCEKHEVLNVSDLERRQLKLNWDDGAVLETGSFLLRSRGVLSSPQIALRATITLIPVSWIETS